MRVSEVNVFKVSAVVSRLVENRFEAGHYDLL